MGVQKASKSKRLLFSWLTLAAVAVLSVVIWRAEVEYHGWEGLRWIGYFHLAIPAGAILFVAWVMVVNGGLSRTRRIAMAIALGVTMTFVYAVTRWSMSQIYGRSAIPYIPGPVERTVKELAYLWFYLMPFCFAALAHTFGLRVTFWRFTSVCLVFAASVPVSVFLLAVTEHPGAPDFIHTIKSGFIIPFLVVAFGILFLPRRETQV